MKNPVEATDITRTINTVVIVTRLLLPFVPVRRDVLNDAQGEYYGDDECPRQYNILCQVLIFGEDHKELLPTGWADEPVATKCGLRRWM
jgi:hypothetical protein